MTTFGKYEYNEYGVCLNPDIVYTFGKWNQYHFEIKVSETPRGWVYGYDWSHLTGGGGGGCILSGRDVFLTKSKAIVAAAEYIKICYSGDSKAAKAVKELDRIIAVESSHKPTLKQYSIFDYLENSQL